MFDYQSDALAICDGSTGATMTFRQLGAELDRLTSSMTLPTKGLIFLFCTNNAASIKSYMAALRSGNAVALLDARLDQDLQQALIAAYEPDLIINVESEIGSDHFNERYAACEANDIYMLRKVSGPQHFAPINEQLALLLPTSGTTGSPKFVRLSLKNLEANARSIISALAISGADRAALTLPIHYSYGLSVVNSHLMAGSSIVAPSANMMESAFWKSIRENRCTTMPGVPYSYEIINRLGLERLNISTINTMTQAGGKLKNDLAAQFSEAMKKRNGRFFVMYGQTEATARICVLPSESLPEKLGSAGKVIPGGFIEIDQSAGETTNSGGEIVYSGANVMLGYASNRADLAKGDEKNGKLHTGDIGYLDEDGFLFVTGRMKRFSKIFGYRINLDEVETLVRGFGAAAVVGTDERIYVFCEEGDAASFRKQSQYLSEKLHLDHSVFEFRKLDALPQNANGKVNYQLLQEEAKLVK